MSLRWPALGAVVLGLVGMWVRGGASPAPQTQATEPAKVSAGFSEKRQRMVIEQLRGRGLRDERVLAAMEEVPRHLFVPTGLRPRAYEDGPLPIGRGQTISQPYVVALMTSLLGVNEDDRVLEIGTGSGYHAAVVSRVAHEVYTIEIIDELSLRAQKTLQDLGYDNIHCKVGDGHRGWPDEAPFDAILLTAAPSRVPQALIDQLKVGGKMVAPVGDYVQELQVITRTKEGVSPRSIIPVRFVPMTGSSDPP